MVKNAYVQEGLLGVKSMSDLMRTGIHGIFEATYPTKHQIRKYKRPGWEWFSFMFILMFIVISWQE